MISNKLMRLIGLATCLAVVIKGMNRQNPSSPTFGRDDDVLKRMQKHLDDAANVCPSAESADDIAVYFNMSSGREYCQLLQKDIQYLKSREYFAGNKPMQKSIEKTLTNVQDLVDKEHLRFMRKSIDLAKAEYSKFEQRNSSFDASLANGQHYTASLMVNRFRLFSGDVHAQLWNNNRNAQSFRSLLPSVDKARTIVENYLRTLESNAPTGWVPHHTALRRGVMSKKSLC